MMVIGTTGVSVTAIIKALHGEGVKFLSVGVNDDRVHTFHLEGRAHSFLIDGAVHTFPIDDMVLTYRVQGEQFGRWAVVAVPSNLPGVEGQRWYVVGNSGRWAQKLHLYRFREGLYFFVRHDYKHLHHGQHLSAHSRQYRYHRIREQFQELIDSKKKLRLTYRGKPTRTARRLMAMEDRAMDYEWRALVAIGAKYGISPK